MSQPEPLNQSIQFETPENVQVQYDLAGLGSRFVAWFVDQLLLFIIMVALFFAMMFMGMGSHWVSDYLDFTGADLEDAPLYVMGLFTLIVGFMNFFYYGLSELLLRGQTIGKKNTAIRVVKVNGYALDAGSILIRNLFRVLDHIPPLWIVPLVNSRSQRLGDMVAGTICITDDPKALGSLRDTLLARPLADREFRFDVTALKKARPSDIAAVERILESMPELDEEKAAHLLELICDPLARRMQVNEPPVAQRQRFLEDLLQTEYHRQQRQLG